MQVLPHKSNQSRSMEPSPAPPPPTRTIKLNVGGRLFETTAATLQSAGPDSLLAALSLRAPPNPDEDDSDDDVIFIDRDPDLFSLLLSLLRSGRLPSSSPSTSSPSLYDESRYFGLDSLLRSATSPPPFHGVDASLSLTLLPSADPLPSALSPGPTDGSLLLAHAGQISSYDWSLLHVSSIRTHLDRITSLARIGPQDHLSAVGSLSSPGLHFYDILSARHVGSAHWSDPSDPRVYKARVTALSPITSPSVFASFECPHFENAVLSVDPATLQIVSEFGRQNASSSKTSAANKLKYIPESSLVFACAVSSGSFGYSGYMRLWDPRSGGSAVWETSEPGGVGRSSRFGDSFADADVDVEELAIYKVCWNSGDVAVADMRMLSGSGNEDPWIYLEDKGSGLRSAGRGQNSVLHCYKKQVFVSRQSGLEVCSSPVEEAGSKRTYVRNYVDTEEDVTRGMVRKMEGGGDRLFVIRDEMEGVEVWESSSLSGAISLL